MSIFRAPLTDDKGDIRVAQVASNAVPAQAVQFRGLWVTLNGLVCGTADTGQDRTFQGGIAFEASSGLMLVGDGSATPYKIPMDGMCVDANGAFLGGVGAGQVVHQGVNFINQSTGGNPRVNTDDPILTFQANLKRGVNSSSIQGVQERISEATYRNVGEIRKVAVENEIRQEQPNGTLMEFSGTNLFLNSNAPATQEINLSTGTYVFSVEGTGSLTSANAGGTATGHGTATEGNPVVIEVTGAGNISFTVAGTLDYVQVEAGNVPSSFIITDQAAGTRATDKLKWSMTDPRGQSIFNQLTGMLAVLVRFQFGFSDLVANQVSNYYMLNGIESQLNPSGILFYYQREADNTDGFNNLYFSAFTRTAKVAIPGNLQKDQDYLCALLWDNVGNNGIDIGFKTLGAWTWGTGFYDGLMKPLAELPLCDFIGSIRHPTHYRKLHMWSGNAGKEWMETYFSGVANA